LTEETANLKLPDYEVKEVSDRKLASMYSSSFS